MLELEAFGALKYDDHDPKKIRRLYRIPKSALLRVVVPPRNMGEYMYHNRTHSEASLTWHRPVLVPSKFFV